MSILGLNSALYLRVSISSILEKLIAAVDGDNNVGGVVYSTEFSLVEISFIEEDSECIRSEIVGKHVDFFQKRIA